MASLSAFFVKKFSVKQLFWLIPIILSIHNLEEALTMPQWVPAHLPLLRSTIPLFNHLHFSTAQLYISLSSVTLFPFLVTFFCTCRERTQRKIIIMLTLQAIIFWNALMPHISGVVVLGMYNPGVVTAVVCNVPFSVYLFKRMRTEGIITNNSMREILVAGVLLYLPVVYINHLLAEVAAKLFF